MKTKRNCWVVLVTAAVLTWGAVPAAAHVTRYLSVRNGVDTSAYYQWQDGSQLNIRVVEGTVTLPADTGKKAAKGSPREVVSVTAFGPEICDFEAGTVHTRVMHGSLLTDDPDGTDGIAIFDGARSAQVNGVIPVHVHDELWTASEEGDPEFLCQYDGEPGGEEWLVDFQLEQGEYSYQYMTLEATWEYVEIVQRHGKGKKNPQTELHHETSFALDLDGDSIPESPETASAGEYRLESFSRAVQYYFHD